MKPGIKMPIRNYVIVLLLLFPAPLLAGSQPSSPISLSCQTALVTQMQMVQCQEPPRHGSIVANFLVGSAPAIPMGAAEYPEYEIEGAKVIYRIRPRRDLLLPVGDEIRFRLHKRDLLVLTDDADKEIVFNVVAMTLKEKRRLTQQAAERKGESRPRHCLAADGEVVPCGDN